MKLRSLFTVLALASVAHAATPVEPAPARDIAAKVNSRVVTRTEVSARLAPIYAQLTARFPDRGPEFDKALKEARDKIMAELIDRESKAKP